MVLGVCVLCVFVCMCVHVWCMYICVCVCVIIFEEDRQKGTNRERQTERGKK